MVSGTNEIIRYVTSLAGCFLLATNLAFILRAEEVFPKQTCLFWRFFFIGKSMITAASILVLWHTSGALQIWRGPLFLIGYMFSICALCFAWIKRPFMGVPLDHIQESSDELTIVQGKEV